MMSELPPQSDFHNPLGVGNDISKDEYLHAQNVWNTFKCKNMAEYTQVYCHLDVR